MAVTPPISYERQSLGPAGPFGSGQPVESASIEDWLANHNHVYAALGMPIAMAFYASGWAGAHPWRDTCLFWRPADVDSRTLVATIEAENTDGSDHTLRISDGSTTASATAVASTADTYTIEWTPDSTTGSEFVLQADNSAVKVYSCTVRRKVLSGSLSDTPLSSGWKWAQASAESAADEPISTEMMNRALGGPYIVWRNQLVGVATLSDSPEDARMSVKDTTLEATLLAGATAEGDGPHGLILGGVSYKSDMTLRIAGRRRFSSLNGTVTVGIGGINRVLTFSGATIIPSAGGPYQWQSVTLAEVEPGVYPIQVSCRNAEVWAVSLQTR